MADAGVLEAVEGKGDFGGAAGTDFGGGEEAGREQQSEVGDSRGGAVQSGLGIERVRELDGEVAVVPDGAGRELGGGGMEFVEFPLGESGVEPGDASARGGGASSWDDDAKAMKNAAAIAVGATVIEPEDAEGEGAVDGVGEFLRANAENGPGGLAFRQNAAGVGGAEAVLEVHGGAEAFRDPAGEVRGEGLFEGAKVAAAGGIARGGGAEVWIGDEGEGLGFGLSEAAGFKPERLAARLDGGDGTDQVFLVGPEMEEAASVVGGDGAVGEAEVEEEAAVFKDGGVGVVGEEVVDGAGQCGSIGS